jgi:hypothetical protein
MIFIKNGFFALLIVALFFALRVFLVLMLIIAIVYWVNELVEKKC